MNVEILDYEVTGTSMTVAVKVQEWAKYRVRFIGRGGRVLAEAPNGTATYTFTGREGYVRAKVIESSGRMAWLQPTIAP